jgi:FkbH-like protein
MFEFDKFDAKRFSGSVSAPTRPVRVPIKAEKSALLLWGEHCIECAAPDCYKTCDLYLPRQDSRCRRFEFGAAPNPAISGGRGPGAEIVFRKWGKLEARGNAYLLADSRTAGLERWALRFCRAADAFGRVAGRLSGDARWNHAGFALLERLNTALRRRRLTERPDGFLFEAYNPSAVAVHLILSMTVDRSRLPRNLNPDEVPRPFARRIEMQAGEFRVLIPLSDFRDVIESGLAFNVSIAPETAEGTRVVFRALDFVKLSPGDRTVMLDSLRPASVASPAESAKRAKEAKCVVFDLDNTLWDGVLLESEGVVLKPFVPGLIRTLDQRGILLSVASKNSSEHASAKLRALGVDEFFLYAKINWAPKSENIKQIAKDLDIGLDTFVFVDDNPFELSEVAHALPDVECLSVDKLPELLRHPRLQGSTSSEARVRRKMYQEAIVRAEVENSFSGDYTEFLRSCRIRLTIRPDQPADRERVSELVQRTNQLNFSGRKYSREEVAAMLADEAIDRFVLACEDKFGSYGTIGFCVVRRAAEEIRVEDFMLSCRVQGKLIESALFHFLCNRGPDPVSRIVVNFIKTDRNGPAQSVLRKLGFDLDRAEVSMAVTRDTFAVDFLEVIKS